MNELTFFNSVILLLQFFTAYIVIVIAKKDANNYSISHFQLYESNKIKILKEAKKHSWANIVAGVIFVFIFLKLDKYGLAGGLKMVDDNAYYGNLLFNPPFFIALISTYFINKIRIVRRHTNKYKTLNNEEWRNYRKKLVEQI